MTDGILTSDASPGQPVWAWCGIEISSCSDLTKTTSFSELSEGDRYQKAMFAETNYLRQFLGEPGTIAIELRWLRDPQSVYLQLVVLGRVFGWTTDAAVEAARALQGRLANLPPHLTGHPIVEDARLATALNPFVPNPHGMVGITKRCLTANPERPDVPWSRHFAVQPLTARAQSWEDALRALYQRTAPTMVGVALEPVLLSPAKLDALSSWASSYGRLAQPGQVTTGGLALRTQEVSPDAFAEFAAPIYSEACQRYRDKTFRIRIAVASTAPVDDGFAEVLAGTISPPMTAGGAAGSGHAVAAFSRSAAAIDRPINENAAQLFQSNMGRIGTDPWGPNPAVWGGYEPPPNWLLDDFMRVVDVEEACAAFRFPASVTGKMPGFPVVTPGAEHRLDLSTVPSLELGNRLDGGVTGQSIRLELQQLRRHALVCGAAGTGKTNTTLNLCRQIWADHHVPFLVIDPVKEPTDYRALMELEGFEDLVVLTGGHDKVAPFRINPFVVPQGVAPIEHCGSLLSSFKAAFGLWEPLPGIYMEALRDIYQDAGFVLDEPFVGVNQRGWPSLEHFVDALEVVVADRGYAGEQKQTITAASIGRARSLSTGLAARLIDCDISYPVSELLSRPTVLELGSMSTEPEAQSLVVGLVLASMTTYFKRNWKEVSVLKHVTVVEEAHRLLTRPEPGGDPKDGNAKKQAAEMFATSLAENRGYGEGVVVVEQVPTKLIQDAIKNSNTKIMHQVPGVEDQQEMGGAMGLTDDQLDFIPSLGQGQAFTSHDGLDRAMHISVPLLQKPLTQASESLVKTRFGSIGGENHESVVSLRPFTDCVACTSPCQFRSRSRSVVGRRSVPELKSMLDAYPSDGNKRYLGDRPTTQAMRDGWQLQLFDHILGLQPLASDQSTAEATVDELSCRFIHLMRAAYRHGRERQESSFRRHAQRKLGP